MDINFIPDNHWHMDINYHMPEGGYNQAISSKKWKVIHPKIHSHLFHNQWHMDIKNHMPEGAYNQDISRTKWRCE